MSGHDLDLPRDLSQVKEASDVFYDAFTFRGAPTSLLDEWETGRDWSQVLIRALLYRLGPTGVFAARNRLRGSRLVHHLERVSG